MAIKLHVAGLSDPGKVRTNNEDAFVVADLNRGDKADVGKPSEFDVKERGTLLAVSDGMGGEAAGEVASALVVETLRQVLAKAAPTDEPTNSGISKAIEHAVTKANDVVFKEGKTPGKKGMGATLTAVYVHGDTAYIAEVGDSRAYLVRGRRIRQMTKDQSFVQLLLDSGALTPEDAENYPHKNLILQAMGQKDKVTVALGKLALRRSDRFVICSDGLSNKVTPDEIKEAILTGDALDIVCKKLIDLANERGGEDNITLILAQLEGDGLTAFRDDERVTTTFEVVKEGPGVHDDDKEARKKKAAAAAPKGEVTPIAEAADATASAPTDDAKKSDVAKTDDDAKKDDEDDDEKVVEMKPPTEEELKSRPLQMVVAVIMILVMVGVFYIILKD
ncbi:hypothetical protein BH09MYX1_BH09MYX1_16580 [soil metagenome]